MGQRPGCGVVVMVMRLLITIAIGIGIASCATATPEVLTPMEVKVPVATPIYCRVEKPEKPTLPIATLKADSAPADTIRAYAATIAVLKGAVQERDALIAGCAPPADAVVSPPASPSGAAAVTRPLSTN